ncbi:MAG: DUF3553 domain-containing protein [Rhodospirillaceae bacterium]
MEHDFTPGMLVINPAQSDWGIGQVQSAVGTKVTVNFENTGKITLNTAVVELEEVDLENLPPT